MIVRAEPVVIAWFRERDATNRQNGRGPGLAADGFKIPRIFFALPRAP